MKRKSYVILNMSDEKNKGDFAILRSLVELLYSFNSNISVINVDLNEKDLIDQYWTKQLEVKQLSAVFPFVTKHTFMNKFISYFLNLLFSLYLIVLTIVFQSFTKYFLFLFPKRFKDAFLEIDIADKVFLKGGSFLYNYGGLSNTLFFFRMIYLTILSIFLKKELYIMGVSIGPLKSKFTQMLIKFIIKHSRKVILREYISYDTIKALRIKMCNILVIPDMAFLASYNTTKNVTTLFTNDSIPYPKNKMKIGITARKWEFPQSYSNKDKIIKNYINVLLDSYRIIQDKYNAILYFIPHYLGDLDFENWICKQLQKDAYMINGDYSLDELVSIYKSMDYTIGVRLHSCILSLSTKTPALHISYMKNKGLGTYTLLGLEDYVIDATNFNSNLVLSKFEQLVKNRKKVINKINESISKAKYFLLLNISKDI